MNRNQNNHFANVPTVDIGRSRFNMNQNIKTTFNAGKLIPFYVREVLPGDTFSIETPIVCRMTTPIVPVMDNVYLDYYYFFVPNRLVYDKWQEFMGENNSTDTPWVDPTPHSVPTLRCWYPTDSSIGIAQGTIADYMGIPTGINGFEVNALPFRSYVKIFNDWFRDQNNMTAAMNSTSEESDTMAIFPQDEFGNLNADPFMTAYRGGNPLPVSKFHDYFTSALPQPQKGDAIPLLDASSFDIIADGDFRFNSYTLTHASGNNSVRIQGDSDVISGSNVSVGDAYVGTAESRFPLQYSSGLAISPDTLGTLANINSLRYAFQVQRFLERDARGGTRYIELLKSHFGVNSPDGRLQRSEYLGGRRVRINVSQVVQTSSTDGTSPQGNTGAYSLTVSNNSDFTKSFVEHGFVIGVLCARTSQSYQQGLEKFWTRRDKFDYYWPVFAHIGEQPILNKELYLQSGTSNLDGSIEENPENNEVFGYQEAWADYRYSPDRVCGAFRSTWNSKASGDEVGASLDSWTYTNYFNGLPTLGREFISETEVNVQRTLAVQNEPQFFADILVKNTAVRSMPVYSVPGLIDHM